MDTALAPVPWRDIDDEGIPSPESALRLRLIRTVGVIALVAGVCYLTWRAVATVPGASWWLAVPLLVVEAHALVTFGLYLHVLWAPGTVPAPEPRTEPGQSVTVLVPTYNEPAEVLLPTLAAAAALEQAHEVWVLDDGDRAWVRETAESLGVVYRSRSCGEHAKAGNINAALLEISTELIAVLDADHVPRADFLANVLGYFADPQVALVQTPQDFYNTASFEHSRRGNRPYCEQDLFYRLLAEARNAWGAAFWCGTNAVVRVHALRQLGGVATETVTEDIHTTIRLHQAGWKTIYHNQVLARGLAAANSEQFLDQRLRWGTGAMQVLRTDNPLTAARLTWHQRLSYASTLLGWFDSWRTLGFVVLPMLTVLTGGLPAAAPMVPFLTIFGATWLLQRLAMQLLARGRAPLWPSTLFEFIRMPAALRCTTAIADARPRPFTVTEKGRTDDIRRPMPTPRLLAVLLLATPVSGIWYVATLLGLTPLTYQVPWVAHAALCWMLLNAAFLAAALHRIKSTRFGSERRAAVRFPTTGSARLNGHESAIRDLSVTGASALTDVPFEPGAAVDVDLRPLVDEPAPAVVRSVSPAATGHLIGLEFTRMRPQARGDLALRLFHTGAIPKPKALAVAAGLNAAEAADLSLARLAGLHLSSQRMRDTDPDAADANAEPPQHHAG